LVRVGKHVETERAIKDSVLPLPKRAQKLK